MTRPRARSLVACALLAGCSLVMPSAPAPASLPAGLDPANVNGPVLVLGGGAIGGTTAQVLAARTPTGDLCTYDVVAGAVAGSSCGPPNETPSGFSAVGSAPVEPTSKLVWAFVGPDVASVVVLLGGEQRNAELVSLGPLGLNLAGFSVLVPSAAGPVTLVARDAGGAELDAIELDLEGGG